MSSKFGMAGGIPERRVRPIWDAVDSRQFKAALKLSTALLSKYPKSPYAIALKGLILERMGKPDEALVVCLNAKQRLYADDVVFIDDLTLSTLHIVFARLDRLDLATSCYEYACGKFANNVELMIGLFNCYVREYSFVKQQQTAIKMYKIVGEERFLLWAVCSIQLQVLCGNGGEKLLLLAEGLLKKHDAAHSFHEPEALLVYVSILEQQAKYKDALEILSGKLGSLLIIEVDRLRIQGRLLARTCNYAAAAEIFKKILESCPDDWECFLNYLGCLLEDDSRWRSGTVTDQIHASNGIDCSLVHLTDEMFDSRIEIASNFVQTLQNGSSSDFVRCPYLATLEIERRKRLYGRCEDGQLVDFLFSYFCRFGHLSCFTTDVEMFLQVMTNEEKIQLIEKCSRCCESSAQLQAKGLGQWITIFKLQELIGSRNELPSDDLELTASRMVDMYCENLPLSKDLDLQENMHGEDLLSMASNVLVQLFWRTGGFGYLLEAIIVLELGLTIRRHVWQYKILLLHLYSHLSALPLAYEWYKTLDVKNILLETALHHILPQMSRSPHWVDLSDILKDYIKFMGDHLRESADLTFLAYRHRTYTKAIEFVQFSEQLNNSYQYLMARLEVAILHLKQNAENIDKEEYRNLERRIMKYFFNGSYYSDGSIVSKLRLTKFSRRLTTHKKQGEERQANAYKSIERRCLLPRMICLSIKSKQNLENPSELKNLLERYAIGLGHSFPDAVQEIVGVSNGTKLLEVFGSEIVDWMSFAVFANVWNLGTSEKEEDGITWGTVTKLVSMYTKGKLATLQPLIRSPGAADVLPILVQIVTEPVAWHTLVIQSCIRSFSSSHQSSGKKKKKSGLAVANAPLYQAIHDSLESLYDTVDAIAKWLKEQMDMSEEEKLDVLVSSLPGKGVVRVLEGVASTSSDEKHGERISQALRSWTVVDVLKKLVTSQKKGLSDFHAICLSKLQLLRSLRQQI
ncbi:hypothetical protein ACHQM5_020449 [Ranunculus cassubicifolius]